MDSPALDSKPETDAYTDSMVSAYTYIQKGCTQNGQLPVSEISAYYSMFEDQLVETPEDFIYLIHIMHQPVIEDMLEQAEKAKNKRK